MGLILSDHYAILEFVHFADAVWYISEKLIINSIFWYCLICSCSYFVKCLNKFGNGVLQSNSIIIREENFYNGFC